MYFILCIRTYITENPTESLTPIHKKKNTWRKHLNTEGNLNLLQVIPSQRGTKQLAIVQECHSKCRLPTRVVN